MEFSRKVKFTLDGEIYFKRINNKSLCSLLTERVTAVCEEQTKLGKVVFRTAIEAEILYQALYVHVQRLNTSLTKCQTRYCMEPRPSVDDCKVMRFLEAVIKPVHPCTGLIARFAQQNVLLLRTTGVRVGTEKKNAERKQHRQKDLSGKYSRWLMEPRR